MDLVSIILIIVIAALVLTVVAFLVYANQTAKVIAEQSAEITRMQQLKQLDNLKLLESRLSPHLFKNILNSIQSHAYQTYFALDKLASVLDYILYDSQKKFVTPKVEIEFAQNLIEINKIKLSPLFELQVKLRVDQQDETYTKIVMAPLISIDMIENAFKHADIQSPDAFIRILIELTDGVFSMTVANKISAKPPLQKDKAGVGSETFEQRLKLLYGRHYTLKKIAKNDEYIAYLKINFREYKTEMYSAGR